MQTIREITIHDTEAHLNLCYQLDNETELMLYEPGERSTTIDNHRKYIQSIIQSSNSTILVAEYNNRLVGYLSVAGGEARRTRHFGYLVIEILSDYTGQGIGTKLFQFLEEWRSHTGIRKFELTVMVHNHAAISLYKKVGFEIEGTKRNSILLEHGFVDEYYMGKIY